MSVARVLAEILLRSLRGRFRRWLRQLRQPRYLVAFLAGVAYFGFLVLPRLGAPRMRSGKPWTGGAPPELLGDTVVLSLALAGALVLTLTWLFSSSRAALPLSEVEIDVLLPAPLTRRQVLSFVLLRTQIGLLFGSFLMALFTSGGVAGSRLRHWAGVWGCLTLFDLHRRGVQLWKARNTELPPARALLRRGGAAAVGLLVWGTIAVCLVRAWFSVGSVAGAHDFAAVARIVRTFATALAAGPLDEILAPLIWLVRSATGTLTAGLGAFLLLALTLHWEWVVRSAARFEDATIERARRQRNRGERQPAYVRASLQRREREPFSLARPGAPELAIYWKNLLGPSRTPLRRQLAGAGLIAGGIWAAVFVLSPPAPFLIAACSAGTMMATLFSVLAGLWMRNDLRQDLLHLETLRPWPIAGHRLVAAELLAPATHALTVVVLGLGIAAAGLTGLAASDRLARFGSWAANVPPLGIAAGILAAALLAVPVTLVSLALQNVGALALPSWMPLGPQRRRRGTAFTGQNILLFLAHMLGLALAALPGAVLAVAAFFVQRLAGVSFHVLELPLLALLGSLSLWLALWLLLRLGGSLWERLDPSQELLAGGG